MTVVIAGMMLANLGVACPAPCGHGSEVVPQNTAEVICRAPADAATNALDLAHIFPASIRTVAIVMPASILAKKTFDRGVEGLERAGYRVKKAARLSFDKVASAEDRAKDFEEAWLDPEVDLVLCARGGSGAEDLLPILDWERLRTRPNQRLLGFSNITMLVNALLAKGFGVPVYGPNLSRIVSAPVQTRDWLCSVLDGKSPKLAQALRLTPIKAGSCRGLPVGGHIPHVLKGVEMGFAPETAGRLVFFEAVSRAPGTIREELDELRRRGYFKNVAGVVFGDLAPSDGKVRRLTGDAARAPERELAEIRRAFAETVDCSVYEGFPFGHVPLFYAIDMTRPVAIDEKGALSW